MKIKRIITLTALVFAFSNSIFSQVGIGTTTPNASAELDVTSTSKGFLPPRMTTADRNAISSPATGLIIWCTNCGLAGELQVYNGTTWINLIGGAQVGTISTLNCAGATIVGALISGTAASGVSSEIPYTNGNAGPHNGQSVNSTGVMGLTATLALGTFVAGNGSLTYTITGTPGSTGTAIFAINIGGQTCNLTRTVGVASSGGTAVVSTWTSTVGCSVGAGTNNSPAGVIRGGVNETMVQGVAAPAAASITLVANVATTGTYTISTNTLNGVTFSATGTFGATGSQTVTLTPTGTPTAAGHFKWATVLTPSIDVYGSVISATAPLGSTYTAHFNGISGGVSTNNLLATYTTGETFNNNATCQSKRISAQGCAGVATVTDGGRTYNTVSINGQCWLQSNLITAPSVYNNNTTTSWTSGSPGDQGYWGYYNTTDATGVSGWQAAEPAANEGRMYQWCGAMNATISERSRGICPAGWHIPSDCEWMYLEHGQGMSIAEQTNGAWRGNAADQGTPGYKIRSQGTGFTNASGFSGLLTGLRLPDGSYYDRTGITNWWTSSASGANANNRHLRPSFGGVNRTNYEKANGFSVRCLKD